MLAFTEVRTAPAAECRALTACRRHLVSVVTGEARPCDSVNLGIGVIAIGAEQYGTKEEALAAAGSGLGG